MLNDGILLPLRLKFYCYRLSKNPFYLIGKCFQILISTKSSKLLITGSSQLRPSISIRLRKLHHPLLFFARLLCIITHVLRKLVEVNIISFLHIGLICNIYVSIGLCLLSKFGSREAVNIRSANPSCISTPLKRILCTCACCAAVNKLLIGILYGNRVKFLNVPI